MTNLLAVVKVLEQTHKDHMAGVTTSYTLMKEQRALEQLKLLITERVENIDGKGLAS